MRLSTRWKQATFALATVAGVACSDRQAGVTAPSEPRLEIVTVAAQGILIGADSNPVTVVRGTSATVNVRVTRTAGFTGPVTLAVDTTGVARGVRATIANGTIATGDTAARAVTITVDTTATATTTPTTFRITASGAGVTTQTLLMSVIVVNQVPGFTFGFAGTTAGATVTAGQAGTVRVVVRRLGGFTGPVTFTADTAGLPRGVTVTQGATAGDTVTLNIATTATAAAGAFNVTLRGTGTGVAAQTLTLPLTVQPVGSFTLGGAAPIAVTSFPGATVTVPIRITRTGGFTGPIGGFAVTGLPAGATFAFDTTATTATTDTSVALRVTLPTTLAAGTYPITVSGRSPGLAPQQTTVTITVQQPGFTIGTVATPLVLLAGAGNAVQLPIVRSTGFTDSVTFAVTGLPTGLSVQSTTVRAGATNTTSTLTFNAEVGLAAGTYPITIVATGPGGQLQTLSTSIQVVANNASLGFQFQLPQTTATVAPGGTTTAPLVVQRIASLAPYAVVFPQNVPNGLTVTLDRTQTTEGTVTMTIAAAANVPPGRYTFQITGATPIGPIPSVTMTVQVTAPATGTGTTTP